MTFSAQRFANPYVSGYNAEAVPTVTKQLKSLGVDDQLAALWYIYTEMGKSITPAAPGAARLQLAEGLLQRIKNAPHAEQLQIMQDLVASRKTPESRAYGVLSVNTKLAFWYELAEWMRRGIVVPMPSDYRYRFPTDGTRAIAALSQLEMNQQITVLRNLVAEMGVDPLLG
jgi:Orange carotenoid protein, N-terminal